MSLLSPSSIAVIGASADEGSVGHDILRNLLTQGYAGKVFPVNPKREEILGAHCYKSVSEIPGEVDLAVIVVPAKIVPAVLRECGEKGMKSVIVISAGFSEVHTDDGKKLEDEIIDIAAKYGIALIGPNCLGIIRPREKMNASFAKELPPEGNVALISQSGALAVAVMDASLSLGIGYSSIISIGNKAVMDEGHVLELCAEDPNTTVIGLYLENMKNGPRLLQIAERIARTKSIVLLKAGVSEHGSKAASSHTGALAGSDAGVDALCIQTGIKRANSMEEFFGLLKILSTQPPLLTNRIAIVTNAGGPGILATDAAEIAGLQMPSLSDSIVENLSKELPASASLKNPIDVIGDAGADRYRAALKACGNDSRIDGVCVLLTPQVMTPCEDIARVIIEWKKKYGLMPVVAAFLGGASVESARKILVENGIPNFETPESAIHALAALLQKTSTDHEQPAQVSELRASQAQEILRNALGKEKSCTLPEENLKELFALYQIPLPQQEIATTAEDAVRIADKMGYPVIAKINSPEILHKTDIGGIKANVETAADVEKAFKDIMGNVKKNAPKATVNGVLIQQFFPAGNEFIVGAVRDPSFGPLVMVGLGGIYTEMLSDTAFRLAPINQEEGYRMLRELIAWKVLVGARGQAQLAIDSLAKLLETISQMASECPQIAELDINPVLVQEKTVIVADAKIVLRRTT